MFAFSIDKQLGKARASTLTTPHGEIKGPFFQFVATRGVIRAAIFPGDLKAMGVQIVLANTYHLHLQPGEDTVAGLGGLHGFMQWNGPVTTDSGGYQVFSLGKSVKIDTEGVTFASHIDGKRLRLTPENAIEIQNKLGADLIMPLDVCTPFGANHAEVERAVEQTHTWAKRCKTAHKGSSQALYGIVQGGVYPDLRERAAAQLKELDFFGYAIGGELQESGEKKIGEVVPYVADLLPEDRPRYLMGYGMPEDIIEAVRAGVDHFDCVLPVRNARHGQIFRNLNREYLVECLRKPEQVINPSQLYERVDISKSKWSNDASIFSPDHPAMSEPFTNGYVHHLMRAEALSGSRLTVLHNIHFYVKLMQAIREVIVE